MKEANCIIRTGVFKWNFFKTLLDAKTVQKTQNNRNESFTDSYENVEPRDNRPNGKDLTLTNIENFTNSPTFTTKPPDIGSSISLDDQRTTNQNCKLSNNF